MATSRAFCRYFVTVSALVRPMKPEPTIPILTSFMCLSEFEQPACVAGQDGLAGFVGDARAQDLLEAGGAVLQGSGAAEQDALGPAALHQPRDGFEAHHAGGFQV